MKRTLAILFLMLAPLMAAQWDIPLNQKRLDGTNNLVIVAPPASGFLGFAANVPVAMTILPVITQQGITETGTLVGGATGPGFTLNFSTSSLVGVIPHANLGTGGGTGTKFLRDDSTYQTIAGGGDALVANPLSQFAATTSAQLKGVLSDELGAAGGKVIFAEGTLVISSGDTLTVPAGGGTLGTAAFTAATAYVPAAQVTGGGTIVTGGFTLTVPATGTAQLTGGVLALAGFSSITGIVPIANLGTGTPDGTKFLRDDGVLAVPPGTGGGGFDSTTVVDVLQAAEWADSINGSDTYTLALTPAITAYVTGTRYRFKTAVSNTGAATLNINALGAKTLVKKIDGTLTGLANNDIIANVYYEVVYDGTQMQLIDPAPSTGGNGSNDDRRVVAYDSSGQIRTTSWLNVAKASGAAGASYGLTSWAFFDVGGTGFDVTHQVPASPSGPINISWPDKGGTPAMVETDIRVKAWVNFDGTSATTTANVSGTYTRTSPSTTVTITVTGHGHIVGHVIYADFTTGSPIGVDGLYTVTGIVDADNFTITTVASTTTSGNVTLLRKPIRTSFNVSSVTYQNTAGKFYTNFSTQLADADYVASGSASTPATTWGYVVPSTNANPTAQACDITSLNSAGTIVQATRILVHFIR